MAQSFTIPKRAYEGFLDLIDLGPDKLDRLTKDLADRELTLDVEALGAALSKVLDFDAERVERAVSTVLLPLSGVRAAFQMAPDEFLKLLSDLIVRQNVKWHEANHERWKGVASAVGRLIAANGYFGLLHKVFQLLVNRPALVRDVKILTEARPVYDDEVTSIRAMLLTSTLVIDYYQDGDGAEPKRLHLALDQEDLQGLQEEIERADKKAQLLEEQVSRQGIPALVAGVKRR